MQKRNETQYYLIRGLGGLDPDKPVVIAEEIVPLNAAMSTQYHLLERPDIVELSVRKVKMSEDEWLEWVQKRTGYEGHIQGRKGKGQ